LIDCDNSVRETNHNPNPNPNRDRDTPGREKAIAQSLINELTDGTYKVCYATKSSEADADADFAFLSREISIFSSVAGKAALELDTRAIAVGQEAVVRWKSTRGYEAGLSSTLDWVGVYRKGECAEPVWWEEDGERRGGDEPGAMDRHMCYLEVVGLPNPNPNPNHVLPGGL